LKKFTRQSWLLKAGVVFIKRMRGVKILAQSAFILTDFYAKHFIDTGLKITCLIPLLCKVTKIGA
jgi:hypothetical protein